MYTGYMSEQTTTQGQPAQYTADGLRVLSNGATFDEKRGRIVSGPTKPPISKANASEMAKRRHEVTRQKLAKAIADISKERGVIPYTGGATDAIAAAGAQLYEQIVLNPDAPARERRDTWLAMGKHTDTLVDRREKADAGDGVTLQIDGATAAELLQRLLQARNTPQSTVIDADSTDTE